MSSPARERALSEAVLALLTDLEDSKRLGQVLAYDFTATNACIRDAAGRATCVWCDWSWASDIQPDGGPERILEQVVDADLQARITRERADAVTAAIKVHVRECPGHPMRAVERARDAWREFARHQEWCAQCAERVDDCTDGSALRAAAEDAEKAGGET